MPIILFMPVFPWGHASPALVCRAAKPQPYYCNEFTVYPECMYVLNLLHAKIALVWRWCEEDGMNHLEKYNNANRQIVILEFIFRYFDQSSFSKTNQNVIEAANWDQALKSCQLLGFVLASWPPADHQQSMMLKVETNQSYFCVSNKNRSNKYFECISSVM